MKPVITSLVINLVLAAAACARTPEAVNESAREIPLVAKADVVIVGGSSGAVAAAVAAAHNGASVFLVAPCTYLGEDLGGTLRLYLEKGEVPQSPLAKALFTGQAANVRGRYPVAPVGASEDFTRVIPLHVKKALDHALMQAGVKFIYSSYPTDVLRDAKGNVAGVVIANRSGRQAIAARTIIDATPRATVARMAGAKCSPYPAGEQIFTRIVIGAPPKSGKGIVAAREIVPAYGPTFLHAKAKAAMAEEGMTYPIVEYTLSIPMADGSFRSFARAEHIARDLTYDYAEENESEMLFQVPPDVVKGVKSMAGAWEGVERLDLNAFQPDGVDGLYVLGGCADVSRQQAAKMLRPLAFLDIGARLGQAAAGRGKVSAGKLVVSGGVATGDDLGEVRETLKGFRSVELKRLPTVFQPRRGLPVLGIFDVVVIGGGTSGAPAGIAAGRKGMRSLVVEYQHNLGGVGTMGMIFGYQGGTRGGFSKEIADKTNKKKGESAGTPNASWKGSAREEGLRTELVKAGGEAWFGTIGCGAVVKDHTVVGAVVATPQGRGVVLGKAVIDATGNSEIAIAAGAAYQFIDSHEFAMQDAGISYREMPWRHINSGYTYVDEADALDVWHDYLYTRAKLDNAFDLATFLNVRERQRIVGDYTLQVCDIMAKRTFDDTVMQFRDNLDTHGYIVDPYWNLACPTTEGQGFGGNLPYRCLLPRGIDGILVVGVGVSAHRDAMPFVRVMPDMCDVGYAGGLAAAQAIRENTSVRKIDVRALQQELVQMGAIAATVPREKDSFPVSPQKLAEAVSQMPQSMVACGIVFGSGRSAVPDLKDAFAKADDKDKILYAIALAMQQDATGLDSLVHYLDSSSWDVGHGYRRRSERAGVWISQMDGVIRALGMLGDHRALPAIIAKARALDPSDGYSHYHSVAYALELMPSSEGADALHEILSRSGMSGWITDSVEKDFELQTSRKLPKLVVLREASCREIMLAAALYRCGDKDGVGRKILEAYSKDLRGLFVRFATAVLEDK